MAFRRIKQVVPLEGHRLRLTLTDGSVIERDVGKYLVGPLFEAIRNDAKVFARVSVDRGNVVWPDGVDLCPDVLIHDGMPPLESTE